MRQTSIKTILLLVSLLLFVTCCGAPKEAYLLIDFYSQLANKSGIYTEENPEELLQALKTWKLAEDIELEDLNGCVYYAQVIKDLEILAESFEEESFQKMNLLSQTYKENDCLLKEDGEKIIDYIVQKINYKSFPNESDLPSYTKVLNGQLKNDVLYSDEHLELQTIILFEENYYKIIEVLNDSYRVETLDIEDFLKDFSISFSSDLDIEEPSNTNTEKSPYKLLSYNDSLSDVFYNKGYRISYAISDNYARVYLSKEMENGLNFFSELILSNFHFDFNWKLKEDDYVYFKTSFVSNERFGISDGKYLKRYIDLKNLTGADFENGLSSILQRQSDEVEAVLPICTIQIPIPNLPSVTIEFEVLCKVYVSGKIELSLSQSNELGFEYKEGAFRSIFNSDHKAEGIIKASGKTTAGVAFAACAMDYRLADVGIEAGIKANASSTLHLLNGDQTKSIPSNQDYSLLDYLTEGKGDVAVCADVSLHWLFDLKLNSARSLLGALGIGRTFEVLNEDHQIFNNLTHIENGHFVDECTVYKQNFEIDIPEYNIDKIVLERYAMVVLVNEEFEIPIVTLPNNYTKTDLILESEDPSVVKVLNLKCIGQKAGNTNVKIKTKDGLYDAQINILVSDG